MITAGEKVRSGEAGKATAIAVLLTSLLLIFSPDVSAQVTLSSGPAFLTPGTTVALDVSVNVGSSPLGGYLYRLSFDPSLLSVSTISASGPLTEFFVNPSSGAGNEPFLGLNPNRVSSPSGSVAL